MTLHDYGAEMTLQVKAAMLHDSSKPCVLESPVGAVTLLRSDVADPMLQLSLIHI